MLKLVFIGLIFTLMSLKTNAGRWGPHYRIIIPDDTLNTLEYQLNLLFQLVSQSNTQNINLYNQISQLRSTINIFDWLQSQNQDISPAIQNQYKSFDFNSLFGQLSSLNSVLTNANNVLTSYISSLMVANQNLNLNNYVSLGTSNSNNILSSYSSTFMLANQINNNLNSLLYSNNNPIAYNQLQTNNLNVNSINPVVYNPAATNNPIPISNFNTNNQVPYNNWNPNNNNNPIPISNLNQNINVINSG